MPLAGCIGNENYNATNPGPPEFVSVANTSNSVTINGGILNLTVGCGVSIDHAGPTSSLVMPGVATGVSAVRSAGVVTLTFGSNHNLKPFSPTGNDQGLVVSGCSDASFDELAQAINTVPNATTLTYSNPGGNTSTTGCTVNFVQAWAHGNTGSTAWYYKVSAIDNKGGMSAAVPAVEITNGASSLTPLNYNWVGWPVTNNARMFAVYRSTDNVTYTCVGTALTLGFADYGLGFPCPSFVPSTPPAAQTAQSLSSVITGISGSTVTLQNTASNTAINQGMYHDETTFLTQCLTDLKNDQANTGSQTPSSAYCLVPAGVYWFNSDMPTDTLSTNQGASIQVAGTMGFQTWPWIFSQNGYSVLGIGAATGPTNFSSFPTTPLLIGPKVAATFVFSGVSGVTVSNFSALDVPGHGLVFVPDPSTANSAAGVQINNIASRISTTGAGVPLIFDSNVLGIWGNQLNLTPRPDGFPASILFTDSTYSGNGQCCIFLSNLQLEWHHVVVDAPGGLQGGQGSSAVINNVESEEHGQFTTGGTIAYDGGNGSPANTVSPRIAGIGINGIQNADASNKILLSYLGTQQNGAPSISVGGDVFISTPRCDNGSTLCSGTNPLPYIGGSSPAVNYGQINGYSGFSLAGQSISKNPIITMPYYGGPAADLGYPAYADSIAPPRYLEITGTNSGGLTAGTYCFVVSAQAAGGGTSLPSPEQCQTVGASSSINLQAEIVQYQSAVNYILYFGTAPGLENFYFTQASQNSLDQIFTFTTTSGALSGQPPTVETAYLTWFDSSTGSCIECYGAGNTASYTSLGIGEPNVPSGDKMAVKGGILEAENGLKTNTEEITTSLQLDETTTQPGISSSEVIYGKSSIHWPVFNPNAAGELRIAGVSGVITPGDCAQFSDTVGTLVDIVCSGGGGGSGTVTLVSSGNFSPLFTVSVANPGTTPAFTFNASTASANTFFGNCTGSTATPNFCSATEAMLPATVVYTDQNAVFGAHTYNYSSATTVTAKVQAAYAPTVDGQFGVNSTTHLPVFGFNSASTITIPVTNAGTTHQWVSSYNQATGALSTTQPGLADISAGSAGAGLFDFSTGTFKLPVAASFVTTANGNAGYDTTNKNWHVWDNAADKIMGVWSSTPTNGQCATASVSSSVVLLLGAVCSGATLQTDGVSNSSQTLLNFTDTSGPTGIVFTNPSGGVESANLANTFGGGNSVPLVTATGIQAGDVICYTTMLVNCTPSVVPNEQTGTSYAILTTDRLKFLTFTNSSATAVSLSAASTTGFTNGFSLAVKNTGAGAVTITPTTSTICGLSTLVILQGMQANLVSDGTNYVCTVSGYASATTGTIGGAIVGVGCDTGTVTINGASTTMVPVAVATTSGAPGAGLTVSAQVTSSNTVTVSVCAPLSLTPVSSTYLVRLFPASSL